MRGRWSLSGGCGSAGCPACGGTAGRGVPGRSAPALEEVEQGFAAGGGELAVGGLEVALVGGEGRRDAVFGGLGLVGVVVAGAAPGDEPLKPQVEFHGEGAEVFDGGFGSAAFPFGCGGLRHTNPPGEFSLAEPPKFPCCFDSLSYLHRTQNIGNAYMPVNN